SEKYENYTKKVLNLLENYEIRGLVDDRNEKTGRKIRDAEMKKIPYMIIVGEQEEAENMISVRKHGGEDLGKMTVEAFSSHIKKEIESTLQQFNV
ncbi:MAG: His/Gly/Thr/Pro-type tRNA ligase C-terminal domain-containing protein, partial [Flavobacteriaceae bacterium]